ncbi:MAG: imidazolonepropionase, partial [Planctomycetota bacterium]
MKKQVDLIISDITELVTMHSKAPRQRRGPDAMNSLGIIHHGAVAVHKDRIVSVGSTDDILKSYSSR